MPIQEITPNWKLILFVDYKEWNAPNEVGYWLLPLFIDKEKRSWSFIFHKLCAAMIWIVYDKKIFCVNILTCICIMDLCGDK